MAGDSFYCLVCGTGCLVTCYPTHCHEFACHNTSCSAHSLVVPKKAEETAYSKLLGWSDGTPGNHPRDEALLGQDGSTVAGLGQMLNNLSLNQSQATDVYSSFLLSKATTTRPKGRHRVRNSDQDSKSTQPQNSGTSKPEPSISEIEPGLFLGDKHCISASFLREMGITAVITVRRSPILDHPDSRLRDTIPLKDRLFLNAEDAQWQDLAQYFPGACDFIDRRLRPYLYTYEDETDARESEQEKPTLSSQDQSPKKQHKVLVHCRKGISRSATIVATYLMFKKRKPHGEVVDMIRRCRPRINPNSSFQVQLQLWYDTRFQLYSSDVFHVPCKEYINLRLRWKMEELKH